MRKSIFLLVGLFLTIAGFAQVKNPVKWNFTTKKVSPTTYEVHLMATLDKGWHVYSQTTPTGGPVPTVFSFSKNPLLALQGNVKEVGKLEQHHEDLFGVDVKQFSNKVDFVQTIKVKGKIKTALNGSVEFMTCNDHECLPPSTQTFSIALN